MSDIRKYTLKEELRLGKKIAEGCVDSKNRLLEANIGLVYNLAFKNKGNSEFDDLVQEGMIGLIKAAEAYDYKKGYKFSTYATPWIIQKIQRFKKNDQSIRVPLYVHERYSAFQKLKNESKKNNKIISDKEAEKKLGFKYVTPYQEMTSLDACTTLTGESTYGEIISDGRDHEAEIISNLTRNELEQIMDENLNEREKVTIQMKYGLGGHPVLTLQQIGEVFGVTRERIRQIQVKGENRIRKILITKNYRRQK